MALWCPGVETSFSFMGVQTYFLMGWASCCCSPVPHPEHHCPRGCTSLCGLLWSAATSHCLSPPMVVRPMFSVQLDGRSWNPSLWGYPPPPGVLPVILPRLLSDLAAATSLLPFIQGLNAVALQGAAMALLHCPVVPRGPWSSWVHCECMLCKVPGWTCGIFRRQTPKLLVGAAPESMSLMLPSRWEGSLLMPSAGLVSWRISLRQFCCDVWPGNSHSCSSVNSHNIWLISYLPLGMQTVTAVLIQQAECEVRGLEWWNHHLLIHFF